MIFIWNMDNTETAVVSILNDMITAVDSGRIGALMLLEKVCYKVSLCENFQRQSCSYIIRLSNGP